MRCLLKDKRKIMNKKPLRLLILEDNPDDAELMVLELEKEGYIVAWEIVETEEDFKKSLQRPLDLILADYKLPSMNALDALEIVKKIAPLVPLVVISGTIGEEFAVECIKAGATDYVLKDKLFRLGPVVKRALKESKEYRNHMQVDIKLRKSYQKLQSTMQDIIRTMVTDSVTGRGIPTNQGRKSGSGHCQGQVPYGKICLLTPIREISNMSKFRRDFSLTRSQMAVQ